MAFAKGAKRNVSPIPERAMAVESANRFLKYLLIASRADWYKRAEPKPKKNKKIHTHTHNRLESDEVPWCRTRYFPGPSPLTFVIIK